MEQLTREQFLVLLAVFIQDEVQLFDRDYVDSLLEPYRTAGDSLVDDALDLIP